ncbi:hypothetical protein ALI144C_37585 [Actinosynnema sp. ALI-1.44]|uniref:nucleotide disphospho-sugar-binding domain-containing protein n=1 Tax=Actinosynnema sp. ALI-1.44 TaxID=1933779 RepID=UPI00097C2C9E|nr:nucleotide disphospho-sugar-binding domain-containing protein [Actinosynnema sp. ALI-1.44]ONI76469.1 hypothetical protein ALI144C_37585 [Actinosynnema sp. ALI-1.44]
MRVLFSFIPGISHLFPLVPLAWAFRAAGHEVLVAFGEHTEIAARTGLHIVDVAPGYDGMAVLEKALEDNPKLAEEWWASTLTDDPTPWAVFFAALNRPLVAGTMDLVDRWRPDLVVYEQSATVGLMAAARCGVPAVQRNLGIVRTGGLHEAVARCLPDLCDTYGIDSVRQPAVTVEHLPPSMLPQEPEGWFMREIPFNGGAILGERLPAPADGPRIAITMGSVRPGGFYGYYGIEQLTRLVGEAGKVNAEFLLALGDVDLAPLGELPPNVRPIGWTPLDALLRTCTAVVHHGGPGTTMTAIEAGIPQLLALDPLDQGNETTGPAVAKRGIGIVTTQEEVDASMLERLLTDQDLRIATREVRAEVAELPSPADVVPRLIALTTG